MNRKEALEILGFNSNDNPSKREITIAYLARQYYIDKHLGESEDVQEQNEEKFKELGAAYKFFTGKDAKEVTNPTDENLDEINSPEDLKLYLHTALLRQDIAFLKKLFSKFKSNQYERFCDYINEKHFQNGIPLFFAISSGNFDLVSLLLEHGADPNIYDIFVESPLHNACYLGYGNIVELLLKHGASLDVQNEKSKSLLHEACSAGHDHIVKLLLERGVDPNMQGKNGKIPLHEALS